MTSLRIATPTAPTTWEAAQDAFLARDLAPSTRRSCALVLDALGAALGHVPPETVTLLTVRLWPASTLSGPAPPATWNGAVHPGVGGVLLLSARRGYAPCWSTGWGAAAPRT